MLTEAMIDLIETYTIGCVATVCPDGAPAVSPKATFLVLDDQTIAFANIRSPQTVENLRSRPEVEVIFLDIFSRVGCRIRGLARYILQADVEPHIQARFKDQWPDFYELIQGTVIIHVTEPMIVTSPSYDVGGTPDQLSEQWLRRYATALGFDVIRHLDSGRTVTPPVNPDLC